jgi:predicted dehydrogenase
MPDRFAVAGIVTRTAVRGEQVEAEWRVPTFRSADDLLAAAQVDFVITSVPHTVTPDAIRNIVAHDTVVLAETPPAGDLDGLRSLWRDVGDSGLVQVAEQYPFSPDNVAMRALIHDGALGTPTWAQVSSTQQYHAVALLRSMLGVGFTTAEVSARSFRLPVVDPQSRAGWADHLEPVDLTSTIATIDFGTAVGIYDYTDNHVRNPVRANRMLVRGTHGELVDDRVTRLVSPRSPIVSALHRWQTGEYLNFEERDLYNISFDGRVLYENPYFGVGLSDEDIAVATLLEKTAAFSRGETDAPYPLAEAAQDQLIAMAISESARTGEVVSTGREEWTRSSTPAT